MQKAKTKFQTQLQDDLNTMEFEENNTQDRVKMQEMESFMNTLIEDSDESDMEGEPELTQAELDELTASLSDWRPTGLDTYDKQLAWADAQSIQVAFIDTNPLHHALPNNDEYIVYIHCKYTNFTTPYPFSQAKELFPAIITWHVMQTMGRASIVHPRFGNPRLAWTVDFWDRMKAPSPDLNDLNMLSNPRDQMSNKKK